MKKRYLNISEVFLIVDIVLKILLITFLYVYKGTFIIIKQIDTEKAEVISIYLIFFVIMSIIFINLLIKFTINSLYIRIIWSIFYFVLTILIYTFFFNCVFEYCQCRGDILFIGEGSYGVKRVSDLRTIYDYLMMLNSRNNCILKPKQITNIVENCDYSIDKAKEMFIVLAKNNPEDVLEIVGYGFMLGVFVITIVGFLKDFL